MKTLTYDQRRWALASILIVALSASASFKTQDLQAGSRELASTEDVVDGKIPTDKGVYKVKYIKDGESVMAIVPKTEGQGTCDYCGTYSLDINFDKNKTDLDSLNVALLQKLKGSEKEVVVKDEKPAKDVVEDSGAVSGETELFAAIEKKCEKKATESKSACLTSELAKKISKNKTIDQDEVVAFYKDFVAEAIKETVQESQSSVKDLSFNRKEYSEEDQYMLGIDPFSAQTEREEYLSNIEEARSNIESSREALKEALTELVKSSGAKFPKLRAEVAKSLSEIMKKSALQIRELRMMAVTDLQNKNHLGFTQKSHEADNLRTDLARWSRDSRDGLEDGLDYLKDRKEISSADRNVYSKYIKQYTANLEKILRGPTYNADGTVTMSELELTPDSDVETRLSREGIVRIDGKIVRLSPEMLSRIQADSSDLRAPEYLRRSQEISPDKIGFVIEGAAYDATTDLIQQRQNIREQYR